MKNCDASQETTRLSIVILPGEGVQRPRGLEFAADAFVSSVAATRSICGQINFQPSRAVAAPNQTVLSASMRADLPAGCLPCALAAIRRAATAFHDPLRYPAVIGRELVTTRRRSGARALSLGDQGRFPTSTPWFV